MTLAREPLREALRHPNVRAFLRLIRQGESSQSDDAYRMLFGGELWDGSLEEHPRKVFPFGSQHTDAFGAYQFMARVEGYGFPDTYDRLSRVLGPSMEPEEQDLKAVQLIAWRKALDDVIAGRLEAALEKCSWEWASLPVPSTGKWRYKGQSGLTMADAHLVYKAWGGTFEEPKAAPQETHELDDWDFDPDSLATEYYGDTTMAPILIPILQAFAPLIPQLLDKFGSGSEVSNRNIAAAKVISDEIVKATNSPNLQAAFEKAKEDPEALKAAKAAVAQVYPELFEVGGGVDAARKAAQSPEFPFWKNGAFWISFILIVMPFMLLVDVFYVHPTQYDANLRTQIVTAVLMVIGMVGSFWLGTSFGSQRKTNLLANKE